LTRARSGTLALASALFVIAPVAVARAHPVPRSLRSPPILRSLPPTADASVTRRNVEVAVAGDPEEGKLLEETMRELLARLGLRVVSAASEPDRSTVLARVVVLQERDNVEVVVADGRDGTVVFRRSIVRDASPSITREEIAHAVRSAVESTLLADENPPVASAPPPPPPPPPPSATLAPPADRDAPRAASPFAIDAATFASAGPVGEGSGPVVRFGAGAAAAWRRGMRPSLGLSIEYALPFEAEAPLLASRANLVAARARPAIEVFRASWLAIDAGVGGGVDVFTIAPRSAVLPASALQPGTTRVDPVVSAAVTAKIALVSSVVLTVALATDVDPVTRRYVLEDGSAREDVLSLWHVRPALALGLGFTALGDGPFAREER
jgi:hypothetical protein